jgi:hypothetical protein
MAAVSLSSFITKPSDCFFFSANNTVIKKIEELCNLAKIHWMTNAKLIL